MYRSPCIAASLAAAVLLSAAPTAFAQPIELHHRLDVSHPGHDHDVALTLDACSGAYDASLIDTLKRLRIPATVFVTRRWIVRNPEALRELLAHPDLFEIEDHGRAHVPAIIGGTLYGMKGQADAAGVAHEVVGGAEAITQAAAPAPHWYRGAGAAYDVASRKVIERLGFRVAGFSLNADDGATLGAAAVAARLRRATPGDIVIAHMNKPASGTARGLASVLPELQARGLRFVTLSQAAAVLPVPPVPAMPKAREARRPPDAPKP